MRVIVIEDDEALRASLVRAMAREGDLEVVGAFGTAEEALADLARARPSVAVVDMRLPGESGDGFIRRARAAAPGLRCVAFSGLKDRDSVEAALLAGACGYVVKGNGAIELVPALRRAAAGEAPLSPDVATLLLATLREVREPLDGDRPALTDQELRILGLCGARLRPKDVAARLRLSVATVRTHIRNACRKLHASGVEEATRAARRLGLLRPSGDGSARDALAADAGNDEGPGPRSWNRRGSST